MKDIIRFKFHGEPKLIHENVTLEQAQEWCNSPHTSKKGDWFDGYGEHGTYCVGQNAKYTKYFTPDQDNH
jgi:hypothetical protein